MYILTAENETFDMTLLPNEVDDIRYCVLDYSDQANVDFYFYPLFFVDIFPRPAADLSIGKFRVQMPLDWSIVIADKNFGMLEIIELKHLNDRDFQAFVYNPLKSFMPEFLDVNIENIYPDISWNVPRLKHGHILAVPLHKGETPLCAFFVKDSGRVPDSLDITKVMP